MHRSLRAERLALKKHNEVHQQPALFQHEAKSGDEFSLKSVAGILENLTSEGASDQKDDQAALCDNAPVLLDMQLNMIQAPSAHCAMY
jgi:hypothetical protein